MFKYGPAHGGTEYMGKKVNALVKNMPKLRNYELLIIPGVLNLDDVRFWDNPKIVWLHNTLPQVNIGVIAKYFYTNTFIQTVHYWIVPSEFAKQHLIQQGVQIERIHVIPNTVEILQNNNDKWQNVKKIQAVYSSNATRGLVNLLTVWDDLDPSIHLNIFSEWHKTPQNDYDFNIENWQTKYDDPRINWYGFTSKPTLQRFLQNEAHLFLYPSMFDETFCISMVEAMSAGLKVCTANQGALSEIGKEYIDTFDWGQQMKHYINNNYTNAIHGYMRFNKSSYLSDLKEFVKQTNKSVEDIKQGHFDSSKQISHIHNNYKWETIEQKWLNFHNDLLETPKM